MAKHRCPHCGDLAAGRCPCRPIPDRHHRPSAWRRGYDAEYRRNRVIILDGDPLCVWCGDPATTADHHPVPLADGGGSGLDNLVPACQSCNSSRGARARRKTE